MNALGDSIRESPALTVNGVTIAFPEEAGDTREGGAGQAGVVVRDVTFTLGRGRILALVGESGAGKSIVALSALGLLPPGATVEGSIALEGEELLSMSPERLRRVRGGRIGTIFQEPMSAFNPVVSIGAQLRETVRAHRVARSRRAVRARSVELLHSVGLQDPERIMRAFPHELSGGQLQRAMIAMAVAAEPIVLIADEPTTALDVTVQAGILDLLRELRDRSGLAVLLITHDMGVVADLADEVVVLREGVVVETQATAELFARPRQEYTRALLTAVPRLEGVRDRGGQARQVVEHPGGSPVSDTPAIELRDVRIAYTRGRQRHVAVDGVSLVVEPGRVLGMVGESGSGKTTIGRALAGLVPLASGSARVAGIEVTRASPARLRRLRQRVGFVFQDPASSFNPRSVIGRSVAEPLRLHTPLGAGERRDRVAGLLAAVRLDPALATRFPHELSGGQRQRAAIARALALDPALLIADEPTSALDVSVQAQVLELVRDLQAQLGFTCLFISHDLAVVRQVADEVAVLRRGRLVEWGQTERVLLAPQTSYTQRLVSAVPVPDPVLQRERRVERRRAEECVMAGACGSAVVGLDATPDAVPRNAERITR